MNLRTASFSTCVLLAVAWLPRPAASQESRERLTLRDALLLARRNSPELAAARAALNAAVAQARQAGAIPNPGLSYGYEQTSAGGQRAWQSVLAVEQPLGLAGVREARQEAARLEPVLGDEAEGALTAARMAYTKGDMSLVEWLDAVRAYQEGESLFSMQLGGLHLRRAALQHAIGSLRFEEP